MATDSATIDMPFALMVEKKNREVKTMINRGFLASVGLLCATLVYCSSAAAAEKNLFNQLVESAPMPRL